jgi:peptidoglycan/xylan/chitin deacetylase (PgdA/CDA1 family)
VSRRKQILPAFSRRLSICAVVSVVIVVVSSAISKLFSLNQNSAERHALAEVAVAAPLPTPTPILTPVAEREPEAIPDWARSRVFHKVSVKPGAKAFALTFDDGPWPIYTRQVLAILRAYDVKATFFMVGQELSRRPEIAREVRDAGHAIGNHSWNHPSRPRDPVAQIERTNAMIEKQLGFVPTIFRPPYGILKNGMARQAMHDKQAVFIWSADCGDWQRPAPSRIANMIIRQARPGGIALMHDGGGNRSHTVAALPIIIRTLRARGYTFVTVPELLRMRYIAPPKAKKPSKSTLKVRALKKSAPANVAKR